MAPVVVTGSAGFLGRLLVEALAERGPVVAIDRLPQAPRPGVTTLRADLLDDDPRVRAALAAAPVVHHLAGCPDVRDPRPDADRHRRRDNVLATRAVLADVGPDAALVVASSSSVYGGSRDGRPCAEADPLRPRGGYARSKVAVERLCAARAASGARVAVVRPFTVAGEGQRPGMALARWIAAAREGRPLQVFGSPRRTRDLTDVRQAVRALVELGELVAAEVPVGTVNLGTGTAVRLGDVVAAIGRVLGAPVRAVVEPAADAEVEHTLADTARLRELLGWVPRTDIDELVARQAAWTGTGIVVAAG
ncbi:NAD-dependent epimerase/dehydratase family protein [Pseudonocardia sp.]|uniref:NAD-dependent epimerase/dehydratase family protein n=1 Tax=Pseudonocardia sp. TaxID=60912 RepID=UPI003D0DC0C9